MTRNVYPHTRAGDVLRSSWNCRLFFFPDAFEGDYATSRNLFSTFRAVRALLEQNLTRTLWRLLNIDFPTSFVSDSLEVIFSEFQVLFTLSLSIRRMLTCVHSSAGRSTWCTRRRL